MLIAVYKVFDCHEWLEASLDSIYDHVDVIVIVNNLYDWTGEYGNTVTPVIEAYLEHKDCQNKIDVLASRLQSQEGQYRLAVDFITDSLKAGGETLMIVDADEIWDDDMLDKAKGLLKKYPDHAVYATRMHTYLKTPFYRVHPMFGTPTVFVKDYPALCASPRASYAPNRITFGGVWFHHLTYVRDSYRAVERKIRTSAEADWGTEVVREHWKQNVWDVLPLGFDLHAFVARAAAWKEIKCIGLSELPAALVESPNFIKYLQND